MKISTIDINAEVTCRGFELCCLISVLWLGCLEVPQLAGGSMDTGRAPCNEGSSSADQSSELLDLSVDQDEAHILRIIYHESSVITMDVPLVTVCDVGQTEMFDRTDSDSPTLGSKMTRHE